MRKNIVLLTILLGLSTSQAYADAHKARVAKSKAVVKEFMGQLKGELQRAMKAGGPVKAIKVCNKVAPHIAEEQSRKHGYKIARTSLKLRNKDNAPDAWETNVLKAFEDRKTKGEDVKKMAYFEVMEENGKKTFRFMKAIPTGKVCLNCHGAKIKPEVKAELKKFYPDDKATGYKIGDIRGAFTISQPM